MIGYIHIDIQDSGPTKVEHSLKDIDPVGKYLLIKIIRDCAGISNDELFEIADAVWRSVQIDISNDPKERSEVIE